MSQMTDVLENRLVDQFRGGAGAFPATHVSRLYTAAPGEAGGGTEASYSGYAAVSVAASLANFAGTQGAGTTVASTGTGGQTSNNNVLTYGTPATSGPQTLTHHAWCDATTPLIYATLASSRVINNGDAAPTAAAGAHTITFA